MNKVYTIKQDHPVIETIRQEILKSPGFNKDIIGICLPSIHDRALCGCDIYGLEFNANTRDVLTINISYFFNPKSDNPPLIISQDINGYDDYTYSSNLSIKLKTFLERNPQYTNIHEWTDTVVHPKEKFRYYSHHSEDRIFSVTGIEGVKYEISFPQIAKNDNGILEWSKPACESLTKMYWRDRALDITFNIKRGKSVWVEGIWFYYDYKDGLIEVYNASINCNSIWSAIKLFEPKKDTYDKIKSEIEKGDLEVKEIKFLENRKEKQTKFKYEELVW